MIDLGTLPGTTYSKAYDINSLGQVVGHSIIPYESYRAFVWTPTAHGEDGTMLDLNSLLDPSTGVGWNLHTATGINDRGQIVGDGYYDADGPGGIDAVHRAFLSDAGAGAADRTHRIDWRSRSRRNCSSSSRPISRPKFESPTVSQRAYPATFWQIGLAGGTGRNNGSFNQPPPPTRWGTVKE